MAGRDKRGTKARRLLGQFRRSVGAGVRDGMNKVVEGIGGFESRGGMRGAFERARVRGERQATRLNELFESKGVSFGRFVPLSPYEEREIRRHYRVIGVAFDSKIDVVKSAYREKMRQFHPDRHAGNPEEEREATRKSQDLTIAYDAIEAYLKGRH